jgi:hypothetical protein
MQAVAPMAIGHTNLELDGAYFPTDERRSRSRHNQYVPAIRRRRHFLQNARIAMGIMQIA